MKTKLLKVAAPLLLGLIIQCSGTSLEDEALVEKPNKQADKETDESIGWETDHNAKLVLLEIEEFTGTDRHAYLRDVFLGQANPDIGITSASTTSWLYISEDKLHVYHNYWEFGHFGILGHPDAWWVFDLDWQEDQVVITARSNTTFSHCVEPSPTNPQRFPYCNFEFKGAWDAQKGEYSGNFSWEQITLNSDCNVLCTGTMAFIPE
jgi:hypothetical protein